MVNILFTKDNKIGIILSPNILGDYMFQNQSDFNQEIVKKAQKSILKKSLITILASAFFIILMGLLMFLMQEIIFGTVFVTLGGFDLLLFIIILLNMKKSIKNQNMAYQMFFDFDEDVFKVTTFKDGEITGFGKHLYHELAKIEERKDYLMIYPTNALFYIMQKDKMVEGDFYSLRTFLYNKLTTRYKVMYKEKQIKKTN